MARKKENVCCFAQTGTSIDIERKTGGTGYSVEGGTEEFIYISSYLSYTKGRDGNTYYGYYTRLNQTRKN